MGLLDWKGSSATFVFPDENCTCVHYVSVTKKNRHKPPNQQAILCARKSNQQRVPRTASISDTKCVLGLSIQCTAVRIMYTVSMQVPLLFACTMK